MTTFVESSCHCRFNVFNIAFPTESLPISDVLCHCNTCRHSTGQLMNDLAHISGVPLAPSSTSEPADLSTLTPYKSSNIATRWFCSRCSAHMFWEHNNSSEPSWYVAAGTLERTEGILRHTTHIWVEDTLDGGVADHLRTIDGIKLVRYATDSGEILPVGWKNTTLQSSPPDAAERLYAHCHCKTNTFFITRPSDASFLPSSPYPDVTHAYDSHSKDVLLNPTDEKWWLRPLGSPNPTHYLAGHCACTSCRTTSGFPIQSWAFVPRSNIFFLPTGTTSNTPMPITIGLDLQTPETRPPGLRHYKSSEGRNREFCGTCGATVFWWGEERPDLVDVSVGLVDERQAGGVRAEGWFEWWKGRVSFEEDAVDRGLVKGVGDGLRVSMEDKSESVKD